MRFLLSLLLTFAFAAPQTQWREATQAELTSLIPARAPVEQERIETEFRTASGLTDGHGKFIAGVVLITAGYSAEGKYSHYFITQAPLRIADFSLAPGNYVFGYHRQGEELTVRFYQAADGKPVGTAIAHRTETSGPIRSFALKHSANNATIVIGRYGIPFHITP